MHPAQHFLPEYVNKLRNLYKVKHWIVQKAHQRLENWYKIRNKCRNFGRGLNNRSFGGHFGGHSVV